MAHDSLISKAELIGFLSQISLAYNYTVYSSKQTNDIGTISHHRFFGVALYPFCFILWLEREIKLSATTNYVRIWVALLYPDILNFTFWNVKISKCKIFLINFLDELGNFKQKKFYTSKQSIALLQNATIIFFIDVNWWYPMSSKNKPILQLLSYIYWLLGPDHVQLTLLNYEFTLFDGN